MAPYETIHDGVKGLIGLPLGREGVIASPIVIFEVPDFKHFVNGDLAQG